MAMEQHNWENVKENAQPMKKGRKINDLERNLCSIQAEADRERREQQENAFEQALRDNESEDPLRTWIRYIKWLEKEFPSGTSKILETLNRATTEFKDDPQYRDDRRYLTLWIKYADLFESPLDIFKFLYKNKIGQRHSLFYQAWATVAEQREKFKLAVDIFDRGIRMDAEPIEALKRHRRQFERRQVRRMRNAEGGESDLLADEAGEGGGGREFGTKLRKKQVKKGQKRTGKKSRGIAPRGDMARGNANGTGTLGTDAASNANGATFEIFEDGAPAPAGRDALDMQGDGEWGSLPSRSEGRKENTQDASAWNKHRMPLGRKHSKPSDPSFDVFADEPSQDEATAADASVAGAHGSGAVTSVRAPQHKSRGLTFRSPGKGPLTASECIAKKPLMQHAPKNEPLPLDDAPTNPAGDKEAATTEPSEHAACRVSPKQVLGVGGEARTSAIIYEDAPADTFKPKAHESTSAPLQQREVQVQQQHKQHQQHQQGREGREAKAIKAAQAAERRALAAQGPASDTPTQTDQFFCASRQIDFGTTPLPVVAPAPVPVYVDDSTAAPTTDVTPAVKGHAAAGLASRPPLPSSSRGNARRSALTQADEDDMTINTKGAMDEMAELFAPSPSPGPVAQSVPVYEDEPEQEFAPQQPESGFGKQITGPTGGVTAEVEADDEDLTLNTKAALEGMLDVFAASPAAPACEQRKPAVPCANAAVVPKNESRQQQQLKPQQDEDEEDFTLNTKAALENMLDVFAPSPQVTAEEGGGSNTTTPNCGGFDIYCDDGHAPTDQESANTADSAQDAQSAAPALQPHRTGLRERTVPHALCTVLEEGSHAASPADENEACQPPSPPLGFKTQRSPAPAQPFEIFADESDEPAKCAPKPASEPKSKQPKEDTDGVFSFGCDIYCDGADAQSQSSRLSLSSDNMDSRADGALYVSSASSEETRVKPQRLTCSPTEMNNLLLALDDDSDDDCA